MKRMILAVLMAAAILPMAIGFAADRPFVKTYVLGATNLTYAYTNTYVAGSAADNLVVMVPRAIAIKFTGECFTNPTVTFSRTSGTNSYVWMTASCPSNTLQWVTNTPPLVFKTSDILKIQASPQHTNQVHVEIHYE